MEDTKKNYETTLKFQRKKFEKRKKLLKKMGGKIAKTLRPGKKNVEIYGKIPENGEK